MDLSEDQIEVIGKLIDCRQEAFTLAGSEQIEVTVRELASLEIVEIWHREDALYFTLTPLGAFRLGMKLVGIEDGGSAWIYSGDPEPQPVRASGVLRSEWSFDCFESPMPGPVSSAIRREEFEPPIKVSGWMGSRRHDLQGLPYPTILFHKNAHTTLGKVCDSCNGRDLAAYEYCLKCDRWGLDGKFKPGVVIKERSKVADEKKEMERRKRIKLKAMERAQIAKEKYQAKLVKCRKEAKRIRQGLKRVISVKAS